MKKCYHGRNRPFFVSNQQKYRVPDCNELKWHGALVLRALNGPAVVAVPKALRKGCRSTPSICISLNNTADEYDTG